MCVCFAPGTFTRCTSEIQTKSLENIHTKIKKEREIETDSKRQQLSSGRSRGDDKSGFLIEMNFISRQLRNRHTA